MSVGLHEYDLELIFAEFSSQYNWQLSLPAKIIIAQGLTSMTTDQLGMQGLQNLQQRYNLINYAVTMLPIFLASVANAADIQMRNYPHLDNTDRVIGGVFILQHMQLWKHLLMCSCWPTH